MSEAVRAPLPVDPDDGDGLRRVAAEDGAVWLPRLIPPADIAPLAELVDAALLELGWIDDDGRPLVSTPAYDAPDFVGLQRKIFPSAQFDALRRHPRLQSVLGAVIGGPARAFLGDLVRVMSPRDPPTGTLPHQDAFYVRNLPVLWTAWLPLVPVPLELGPLAVWPGSCRLGELPHLGEGIGGAGIAVPQAAWWAATDMLPGDVWLFEGRTVHRSLPNTTAAGLRRSVDFRYVPAPAAEDGDPDWARVHLADTGAF